MKLHYWQSPTGARNFGDELNPWLWPRLFPGAFDDDPSTLFVGIGTLLNDRLPAAARTIVFGSGVGYFGPPRRSENWHILCVRGPLSADVLGIDPALAITDPALLARRFVTQPHEPVDVAYMPHWSNAGPEWERACRFAGIRYIDPTLAVDKVFEAVLASKILVAEAMHGAIIADALRVPWIPVTTRRGILEFKWQDWCASVGLQYRPARLTALWPAGDRTGWRDRAWRLMKHRIAAYRLRRLVQTTGPTLSDDAVVARLEARLDHKLTEFRRLLVQSS